MRIQSKKSIPTKTDYKFLGWYTKDGTDGDWGEEFTAGSTVSEDTTVYAKWEQLYWVTFDLNGGTADSAINPIYHGDPLPTVIPTKADVKFGGWFTKNGEENGGRLPHIRPLPRLTDAHMHQDLVPLG